MKKVVKKFKTVKEWILLGEKVLINKLETRTSEITRESMTKRVRIADIDPQEKLKSVVANTAKLNNGQFIKRDNNSVIARITDLVGKSLIMTDWIIPNELFNEAVVILQVAQPNVFEDHQFHIITS